MVQFTVLESKSSGVYPAKGEGIPPFWVGYTPLKGGGYRGVYALDGMAVFGVIRRGIRGCPEGVS